MKTYKVNADQLAGIINQTFIQGADADYLREVEKVIKGSKVVPRKIESMDGKFVLYVSAFNRGLTTHRKVWVGKVETEEFWEWNGYTLGPIIDATKNYFIAARLL